jgi:hypothetical protein
VILRDEKERTESINKWDPILPFGDTEYFACFESPHRFFDSFAFDFKIELCVDHNYTAIIVFRILRMGHDGNLVNMATSHSDRGTHTGMDVFDFSVINGLMEYGGRYHRALREAWLAVYTDFCT